MDDWIGLLVFLLISGVSIAKRYMDNKKAEEERQRKPLIKREDLPEVTRKIRYGDEKKEPPKATPRHTPPPVIITRSPKKDESFPPIPQPVTTTSRTIRPTASPEEMPTPRRSSTPPIVIPEVPVRMAPKVSAVPPVSFSRMEDENSSNAEGSWAKRQEAEHRRQLAGASSLSVGASNESPLRLGSPGDLRRAIILREVLGPPLSLRREGDEGFAGR